MKKLQALYRQYREPILYIIFGVLTTLVNWAVYYGLKWLTPLSYGTINVIAWIVSIAFAFFTNQKYVFDADRSSIGPQAFKFLLSRLFSLGAELLVLYAGVELLGFKDTWVKIPANVVVIVLNYFLSKLWCFKKKA